MIHRYLPYTISLGAPVIFSSLGGDPNSSRALPFIPGSALRGAAAHGLGDPAADPAQQREFRSLILDGSVRYLNAYPRAGGRRTLPVPASFRMDKDGVPGHDGAIEARDLAAVSGEVDPANSTVDWPEASLMSLSEGFVSIGAAQPQRVEPRRSSRIHQQRDRSRGRAWKEDRDGREEAHGAIFAFEYLEPGQDFDGLILLRGQTDKECEELAKSVQRCLVSPILLGRSRRGGYGGDAEITWHAPRDREVEGQGLVRDDVAAGTEVRVLLTSAYVGRDSMTGQINPAYLAAEIVSALSERVDVLRRRWAFEPVGGFNRKWRLEVPQALACSAGSVLVLRATAPIPIADLIAVEHAGLGERRVEGFGRVVFMEAPASTVVLRTVRDDRVPRLPGNQPPDLVRVAERRILDGALQREIAVEAARLAKSATSPPTPSLLGRLRTTLRSEPESGIDTLRQWLGDGDGPRLKRPAMDQLDRCRLGGDQRPLSAWLREMARDGDSEQLGRLLRLDTIAQRFHVISEDSARQALAARGLSIRSRLIDSVLAALARHQRSQGSRS